MPVTATPLPITAVTRRSILLLSLACFCSMFAQRVCDPMLPALARVFSVDLSQAAQVVSLFALGYGVAQFVYGPLGDRLGKFRIVAWASLACCLCSVMAALAGSLPMLLFARMAMGIATAAIVPLTLAWIGEWYPSGNDTIERVAAHNFTGELGACDAFLTVKDRVPEDVLKTLERIIPDEQFHVKIGRHVIENYCVTEEQQARVRARVERTFELEQAGRVAYNRRMAQLGIGQ